MVGLVFGYLNWPDVFKGIVSGPILVGIAILLMFFEEKEDKPLKLISSRVTIIHVYILPFLLIAALITSIAFIFIDSDFYIAPSVFLGIVTTISVILSRTLWEVRMDNENFYFKSFNKEIKKSIAEMDGIYEDLNGLMYRIDFKERGYYFLPDFFERIQNLFGVPDSIKEIKKLKGAVHNPKK